MCCRSMPRDNRSGTHNRSKSLHSNVLGNGSGGSRINNITGTSGGGGGGSNDSSYNGGTPYINPINFHLYPSFGGRQNSQNSSANRSGSVSANCLSEGGNGSRYKFFIRSRNNGPGGSTNCPIAQSDDSILTAHTPSTSKQWRESHRSSQFKPNIFSNTCNTTFRHVKLLEIQRQFPLWLPEYRSSAFKVRENFFNIFIFI